MHGTAKKTTGGLTKKQLKYNKQGKIVSRKASTLAKKNNRLVKAGYVTRKGVFGVIMKGGDKSLDDQLIDASKEGDLEKVRDLLSSPPPRGADVNAKGHGHEGLVSALHFASIRGHVGVVEVLLAKGANKNAVDGDLWTPLHLASSEGHVGVVERLLKRGADKNKETRDAERPIDLARFYGHPEVVRLLSAPKQLSELDTIVHTLSVSNGRLLPNIPKAAGGARHYTR
jgi:ankyrin repeat protein